MQAELLKKMFEYNLAANTRMIELCMNLSDEQLAVEAEGVYGQIKPLLVHTVRAEGGYIGRLTGKRPWAEDLDMDSLSLAELLEKAKVSGNRFVEIVGDVDPSKSHTVDAPWGEEYTFFNWTVVLQALYHGIEHRTQIKFLLTKLGVEHPDFAAWDYMETLPPNSK
ncbi:MAG: DinB family protein [Chloroflexota bacterium]